jgi:hypothetical protein
MIGGRQLNMLERSSGYSKLWLIRPPAPGEPDKVQGTLEAESCYELDACGFK